MRCPVVVGRDEELAALADAFSRAVAGCGACVVVTGEAGVGKTRLVTEAADGARGRGQVVLAGRSTPTDRVSPLRPLGEALLHGLRDVGQAAVAAGQVPGRRAALPRGGATRRLRPCYPVCEGGQPCRLQGPVLRRRCPRRSLPRSACTS